MTKLSVTGSIASPSGSTGPAVADQSHQELGQGQHLLLLAAQ